VKARRHHQENHQAMTILEKKMMMMKKQPKKIHYIRPEKDDICCRKAPSSRGVKNELELKSAASKAAEKRSMTTFLIISKRIIQGNAVL
jgi:hypothetical protein